MSKINTAITIICPKVVIEDQDIRTITLADDCIVGTVSEIISFECQVIGVYVDGIVEGAADEFGPLAPDVAIHIIVQSTGLQIVLGFWILRKKISIADDGEFF
jgi:hypothetical protein